MKKTTETNNSNRLAAETSPYLLQHSNNPVNWYPWGEEAVQKAKVEDKLIIVSVGYSACHWCHVMEHESFEDSLVAELMNEHFISIKVDREERPDVDNVYMDALHLMGQRGGWPLNCICLPDGRPIYGGTYFPKENWMEVLQQLAEIYRNSKQKMLDYAQKLSEGMSQQTLLQLDKEGEEVSSADMDEMVKLWAKQFDYKMGGEMGAPKFPMPNSLSFLLRYYYFTKNDTIKDYLEVTLDKMAAGGIYDHLGGGFARYSTDDLWKVPHFEKMLYDNAQLVSLYSEAYKLFQKPRYKEVVYETLEFINRELAHAKGGFYSALDADSEGVEGKYYVWSYEEIQSLLGDDFEVFSLYYGITKQGNWEEEINVLHNSLSDEKVAAKSNMAVTELHESLLKSKRILFEARQPRIRPGTDTKILCSWNALTISAFVSAYKAFGQTEFLETALEQADFIKKSGLYTESKVNRMELNSGEYVPGFLDDYALLANAYVDLYQSTFDEKCLGDARRIIELCMDKFYDENLGVFHYAERSGDQLFAPKYEIADNVIPSSNSVMANMLHQLGIYYNNTQWVALSTSMLKKVSGAMLGNGRYYSNWAVLACHKTYSWPEVVVVGTNAGEIASQLGKNYNYYQLAGSIIASEMPLFRNRFIDGKTPIYICENQSCKMPVYTLEEALGLLH